MNKKILSAVVAVIAIIIIAVAGYFLTGDMRQEKKLIEEVNAVSRMNIMEEDVNLPIKTTGKYAVIEKAIKGYLSEFSTNAKEVTTMLNDQNIAKVLSADNYKEDGPEFTKTKEYISTTKTNFNEKMNRLVDMCKEETILENIKKENLGSKYEELYQKLMFDDKVKKELEEAGEQLSKAGKLVNDMFDIQEKVITLLAENPTTWKINASNQIEFNSQSMLTQYNQLARQLSNLK